jgi:hypothetical protein
LKTQIDSKIPAYGLIRYFFSSNPRQELFAHCSTLHDAVREARCAAVRGSRGLASGHNVILEEVVGLFEIATAAGIEVEVGLNVGDAGQGRIASCIEEHALIVWISERKALVSLARSLRKSPARMYKTGQHKGLYKKGQREHLKVPRMELQKTSRDEVVGRMRGLASKS